MSNLEVRINGDPSGVLSAFVKVGEGGREMAMEFGRHALEMATAALGIKSALESVVEGIKKADEVRDLALSLDVFTGSTAKGTEALKFFEEQARNTRDTGDQLAALFRDALPQAVARGFSQDTMQHVTVWLSQLGTIADKSTDEMVSGFEQLLAGKVSAGKNPLLKVLGITKADAESLGWENVIQKMEDVSEHFPQFGQSFESTLKKAKEELLHTFGDGFNEARGEAGKGMDAINIAITSAKPYIKDLGKAFAEFIPTVIRGFEGAAGAIRVFIGGLETGAGLIIGVIAKVVDDIVGTSAGAIATLLEQLSAFWHALPPEVLAVIKVMNPAIDLGELDKGAAKLDAWAAKIRGAVDSFHSGAQGVIGFGTERMGHGADQVREGIEMITKAQQPLTDTTNKSSEAIGKLTQNVSALGKVAIDTQAGHKLEEARLHIEALTESIAHGNTILDLQIAKLSENNTVYQQFIELNIRIAEASKQQSAGLEKIRKEYGLIGDGPEIQALLHALDAQYDKTVRIADLQFNKSLDQQFMGGAFGQQWRQDFLSSSPLNAQQAGMLSFIDWETEAKVLAKFVRQEEIGRKMADDFRSALASGLQDLFATGGKNLGEVAGQYLSSIVGVQVDKIVKNLLGAPGDARLTDASTAYFDANNHVHYRAQDPNVFYDAQGNPISDARYRHGQEGLTGLAVGYSGYQAGLSGQSGARTGAVIEGAMAGMSFGPVGAIIGAIIGAIGGALGASERQSEYKYAVPWIRDGNASLTNANGNINAQLREQMVAQMQDVYDTIRDSLVLSMAKIPGAVIPGQVAIGGPFQKEASGHFMEHWQQFIDQTLPRAELSVFGNESQRLMQTMGMSAQRSAEIWGYLEHVDPKKAVGLIDSLFSALEQHSKLTTYWGGSDLAHATTPVSNEKLDFATNALWWGQNQSRLSITSSFDDVDSQLLQLSGALDQLSESGRIQAFGQIVQLEEKRDSMMRQAAQDLYSLWKTVHDEASSDLDTLKVAGMKRSDGSPDNEAIAAFYRHKSEQDLFAISGASNTDEARVAWETFRRDVMQAFQAGSSIVAGTHKWDDPTMPGLATASSGFDWNKWATNFLGLGQGEVEGAVHRFGGQIDDLNATFNSKLDPAINDFITKTTTAGSKFDDVGGAIDRVIEPIDRFTIRINSTGDSLSRLESAVDNLVSRLNAAHVNGTSSSSNNNIVAKTLAQRMLA